MLDNQVKLGNLRRLKTTFFVVSSLLATVASSMSANAGPAIQVLHAFSASNSDGVKPLALTFGPDGNLYGIAENGGAGTVAYEGDGTLFEASTTGNFQVLLNFEGWNGFNPETPMIVAGDGNLYGTTLTGGEYTSSNPSGFAGVIYQIIPGSGAQDPVFYFYPGASYGNYENVTGGAPTALCWDPTTSLMYGFTLGGGNGGGGSYGVGAMFDVAIATSGQFPEDVLYNYSTASNLRPYVYSQPVVGPNGNLYATNYQQGAYSEGAVFEMPITGGTPQSLHAFTGYPNDGAWPAGALTLGPDGNFYGVTTEGGPNGANVGGYGTVFQISPDGTVYNDLYDFSGAADGWSPAPGLTLGSDGNLYGATEYGGPNGAGTIFNITTAGVLTTLYSFGASVDGLSLGQPMAPPVQGTDGEWYGTTTEASNGSTLYPGAVYRLLTIAPPTTNADLTPSGTDYGTDSDNWWTSNVQVTFNVTAGTRPVANTYYILDGGAQTTYTGPFVVSGSEVHNLSWWSVDTGGLAEQTQAITINVDTTPPVTTSQITGTVINGDYVDGAQVSLSATDNVSGVATTYYTLDGGATQTYSAPFIVSTPGNHSITYWSVNLAGVTEATNGPEVFIVVDPSITSISPNSAPTGSTAPVITVTGTDFLAGCTATINGTAGYHAHLVNSTEVTFTMPSTKMSPAHILQIQIENPAVGAIPAATSNGVFFSVYDVPVINSLTPNNAPVGPQPTIAISGQYFDPGCSVVVNGTSYSASYIDSGDLSFVMPSTKMDKTHVLTVEVQDPNGQLSNPVSFTVTP